MRQLKDEHKKAALDYLSREPEVNLFLIGDIENYGMESEQVKCYTGDDWDGGEFPYFILDYRDNYLVYSFDRNFAAGEVSEFLMGKTMHNLSGKLEIVESLVPLLGGLEVVPTHLARLDSFHEGDHASISTVKMGAEDTGAIYDLLIQIEEFFTLAQKPREQAEEDILESITCGGRMYGVYEGGRLISVAGTSAENSMSAMVVSVATLPDFRRKGYAAALVSHLCRDCFDSGMKFLCLFYDNPEAGVIYERLGFRNVGMFAMVKSVGN